MSLSLQQIYFRLENGLGIFVGIYHEKRGKPVICIISDIIKPVHGMEVNVKKYHC